MSHNLIRRGLVLATFLSFLSLFSILFIDKPLALWVHSSGLDQFSLQLGLGNVTEGFVKIIPILALVTVIMFRPIVSNLGRISILVYGFVLTIIALWIKSGLKMGFGRYWVATWKNDNPSLIHNGTFGFDWFHGDASYGSSFPSGHIVLMGVICTTLGFFYPKAKFLWCGLIAVMGVSLIALNYHFLGDCFAGLALTYLVAYPGIKLYFKVCALLNIPNLSLDHDFIA